MRARGPHRAQFRLARSAHELNPASRDLHYTGTVSKIVKEALPDGVKCGSAVAPLVQACLNGARPRQLRSRP